MYIYMRAHTHTHTHVCNTKIHNYIITYELSKPEMYLYR